jgi:hypothetical protein
MRRKNIIFLLSAFLFYCLFAADLFAQDEPITPDQSIVQEQTRVIEEELVLKDPTVAQPKKWLVGGSGELWYVGGKYTKYDNGTEISNGNVSGSMPGGTIYVGYDDFTLSYSYRKGSWDIDMTYVADPTATSVSTQDQTEHEITARWLFKVSSHFNPYVLVGYNQLEKTETEVLDALHTWAYNGSRVSKIDYTFKSPLIGIGAIIPFNKQIGLRADGRLLYSWADSTRDDGYSPSGTGVGGGFVGTFYCNIWQGLNLQVGGKIQYLNGGNDVGWAWKNGIFAMLGYTVRF